MITVLHIVPTLSRAGTELFVMNNFRMMDRTRFKFKFLAMSSEYTNLESEIISLGGSAYYCDLSFSHIANLSKSVKHLASLLRSIDYDILHCHICNSCGPIFLASYLAGKKNCVAHSHFSCYSPQTGGIFRRFIYKKFLPYVTLKCADALLACSDEAAKALYGPDKSCVLVKNAIDIDKFAIYDYPGIDALKEELQIPPGVKVYGNVSRFEKPKNNPFVVDVFNAIHSRDKSSMLILVGKKRDLYSETVRKIEEYSLQDSVRILDQREDVHLLLQLMDCVIFPSQHEGFGLSIVESQAAMTPVICSDCLPHISNMDLGLVKYVSLSDCPDKWADEAMAVKKKVIDIDILHSAFALHGMELRSTAELLEDIYSRILVKYSFPDS